MSELDTNSLSKMVANPTKFAMMDSHISLFFLSIFWFQNMISVVLTLIAVVISILLKNNGYPMSMMIRLLTRKMFGRKRRRHFPVKSRDHLFTE